MTDAWHNKWLIHHDWLSVITEVFSLNIDFGSTGPFFLDFFPTSVWKKNAKQSINESFSKQRIRYLFSNFHSFILWSGGNRWVRVWSKFSFIIVFYNPAGQSLI